MSDHAGAYRVVLDISQSLPAVSYVEGTGELPVLPEVSHGAAFDVDVAGIVGMSLPERSRQGVGAAGHDDQVDVVVHKAISPQAEAVPLRIRVQQFQVEEAVMVGVEDSAAIVPALRDVVRQTHRNRASDSRHEDR
jgi:hypothetical protein